MVVTCVSMIVKKALLKPTDTAEETTLPFRSSSRMRSKIKTFESTAMPMVKITPAMPGSVSVALKITSDRQQQYQVQYERKHRVDARQAGSTRA